MRPLEVNINPLAGFAGYADDMDRCGSDAACRASLAAANFNTLQAINKGKLWHLQGPWMSYQTVGGPMTPELKKLMLGSEANMLDYALKYGLLPVTGANVGPQTPTTDPGLQLKLPESVQTFIDQAGNVVDSVTGKILKPAATTQLVPGPSTSAYNRPSGAASAPFSFSKFMTSGTGIALGLGLVGVLGGVLIWKRRQAKKALSGLGCAIGLGRCGSRKSRKSRKARR